MKQMTRKPLIVLPVIGQAALDDGAIDGSERPKAPEHERARYIGRTRQRDTTTHQYNETMRHSVSVSCVMEALEARACGSKMNGDLVKLGGGRAGRELMMREFPGKEGRMAMRARPGGFVLYVELEEVPGRGQKRSTRATSYEL